MNTPARLSHSGGDYPASQDEELPKSCKLFCEAE